LAQDSEEPEVVEDSTSGDSLTRVFEYVEDLLADDLESGEDPAADDLSAIAEQFQDDVAPLIEEIKELANAAIDAAVDSGALSEELAERARDRVERFALPEGFPFLGRGFRLGTPPDFECFPFRFGPEGFDSSEDCPDFELPERFELPEGFELPEDLPFGPNGFEFRFGPLERFGEHLDEFVEGLDIDLDELRKLLESGMSLDEALQELGTDLESLLAEAREQALVEIDELVADGELSEEQADRIKELVESIQLETIPFGLHRFDLESGELSDLRRWGRDHGFRGPWHDCDDEDPAAKESQLDG
jgi:polyhydroxyalkanoate synthesis regulator phasin